MRGKKREKKLLKEISSSERDVHTVREIALVKVGEPAENKIRQRWCMRTAPGKFALKNRDKT